MVNMYTVSAKPAQCLAQNQGGVPSFSGDTVIVSPPQEKSDSTANAVKVGLALAAAAGIGFLLRRPKVVEKMVQGADNLSKPKDVEKLGDGLTEISKKTVKKAAKKTTKKTAKKAVKKTVKKTSD